MRARAVLLLVEQPLAADASSEAATLRAEIAALSQNVAAMQQSIARIAEVTEATARDVAEIKRERREPAARSTGHDLKGNDDDPLAAATALGL